MTTSCRSWWRNCALEADGEILAIDKTEDHIAPIAANVSKIRELISSLELCHHKAERWVNNIIETIGTGETNKGLGTRSPGQQHPTEKVWQRDWVPVRLCNSTLLKKYGKMLAPLSRRGVQDVRV